MPTPSSSRCQCWQSFTADTNYPYFMTRSLYCSWVRSSILLRLVILILLVEIIESCDQFRLLQRLGELRQPVPDVLDVQLAALSHQDAFDVNPVLAAIRDDFG